MFWHISQPVHSGVPESRVWHPRVCVALASDGVVQGGSLLLPQRQNQLLFGIDELPNAPFGVTEESHDAGLLETGWDRRLCFEKPIVVKTQKAGSGGAQACRFAAKVSAVRQCSKNATQQVHIERAITLEHGIVRTYQSVQNDHPLRTC